MFASRRCRKTKCAVLAFSVLLAPVSARSEATTPPVTAGELLDACISATVEKGRFCAGYIAGIYDMKAAASECFASAVSQREFRHLLLVYISEHFTERNRRVTSIMPLAMTDLAECDP